MYASHILIVSLALTIVSIGTLTVPSADDQVSALMKDHAYQPAHDIAETRYAAGDRSLRVLQVLYDLRAYFGDIEGATKVLEELASEKPNDIEVQLRLAEHYKSIQRIDLHISALEKIVSQDISQQVAHNLLGYYRYIGNTQAEIHLLERLIEAKLAVPAMTGRLGLLLLSQGQLPRATELLLSFDKEMSLSVRPERLTLFELLMESGRYEEAFGRAVAWLRVWRDPAVLRNMMERFHLEGKFTLASRLAKASHVETQNTTIN